MWLCRRRCEFYVNTSALVSFVFIFTPFTTDFTPFVDVISDCSCVFNAVLRFRFYGVGSFGLSVVPATFARVSIRYFTSQEGNLFGFDLWTSVDSIMHDTQWRSWSHCVYISYRERCQLSWSCYLVRSYEVGLDHPQNVTSLLLPGISIILIL